MSVPPLGPQLHCHHCQRWLGETSQSLVFVGMFKDPRERERVTGARDSWRCKSCGWTMVFQAPEMPVRAWRDGIDLKRAS